MKIVSKETQIDKAKPKMYGRICAVVLVCILAGRIAGEPRLLSLFGYENTLTTGAIIGNLHYGHAGEGLFGLDLTKNARHV